MGEALVIAGGVAVTSNGLVMPDNMAYEDWEVVGQRLRMFEGAVQWCIGDWLNYGERAYGEKYAQAVDVSGRKYQTVANEAWVAGRVELSRRRESLSWSHHAEVASLERDEQDSLLTEAESRGWNQKQLRDAVRHYRVALAQPEVGPVETCSVTDLHELIARGKTFDSIYADPPWKYGNQGTRGATSDHYVHNDGSDNNPGMEVDDICALPIAQLAAGASHLHLWTTNAFLFEARRVMEAWGFEYKSCFVWVKPQMGMGNYWRVSHEFCLLGVRGSLPFAARDEMSWREWRRNEHSAKPEGMYDLIERVSPGPHLELFARQVREGWTCWGNEVPNFYQQGLWTKGVA